MQEQKAAKTDKIAKKGNRRNLLFFLLAGILLLAAGAAALWPYRRLQLAEWRETASDFPVRCGNGTELENVEGRWHSSAGDARMELRAAYYPTATLTLGEAGGAGLFMLRFMDSRGEMRGDIHVLPYRDGKFQSARDISLSEDARCATVRLEEGFTAKEAYLLHCLCEQEALWRIHVWHKAEGSGHNAYVGFRTIRVNP